MHPVDDKPIIDLKTIRRHCDVVEDGNKTASRICRINGELGQGYYHIGHFKKAVTFFGGARFTPEDPWYAKTRHLAERIARETGFAIITGGGPGIMEAANRGAKEGGGQSIGVTIQLPHEQSDNPYLTESIPFNFFFTRKTILTYASEMYIACPGGFGTLDELMEILTLMQTKKVPVVPVFLYGTAFWNPLLVFIKQTLLKEYNTIALEDLDFFKVTDDDDEIIATLKKVHIVKGY
jgi:uncharacterized protein (TIGR00730 family)